jgi:hypothetical protein
VFKPLLLLSPLQVRASATPAVPFLLTGVSMLAAFVLALDGGGSSCEPVVSSGCASTCACACLPAALGGGPTVRRRASRETSGALTALSVTEASTNSTTAASTIWCAAAGTPLRAGAKWWYASASVMAPAATCVAVQFMYRYGMVWDEIRVVTCIW